MHGADAATPAVATAEYDSTEWGTKPARVGPPTLLNVPKPACTLSTSSLSSWVALMTSSPSSGVTEVLNTVGLWGRKCQLSCLLWYLASGGPRVCGVHR